VKTLAAAALSGLALCGTVVYATALAETLRGSNRGERLVGSHGSDYIKARGGNDRVRALGGDDLVSAGPVEQTTQVQVPRQSVFDRLGTKNSGAAPLPRQPTNKKEIEEHLSGIETRKSRRISDARKVIMTTI
jgi:hypothetical protein